MKQWIYTILLGCLAGLAACSQEDEWGETGATDETQLTVYIEQDLSTRTSVDDTGKVTWNVGDTIGVFGSNEAKNVPFIYSHSDDNGASIFIGHLAAGEEPVTVYYPYHKSATLIDHELQTILPAERTADGTSNGPMLGSRNEDGSFLFKHLCGLLKFTVKSLPEDARWIVLNTEADQTLPVAGKTRIALNDNYELTVDENEASEIRIPVTGEDVVCYVPLPTGTYPQIEVSVRNGQDDILDLRTATNLKITRAVLLEMADMVVPTCSSRPVLNVTHSEISVDGKVNIIATVENIQTLKDGSVTVIGGERYTDVSVSNKMLTQEVELKQGTNRVRVRVRVVDACGNLRSLSRIISIQQSNYQFNPIYPVQYNADILRLHFQLVNAQEAAKYYSDLRIILSRTPNPTEEDCIYGYPVTISLNNETFNKGTQFYIDMSLEDIEWGVEYYYRLYLWGNNSNPERYSDNVVVFRLETTAGDLVDLGLSVQWASCNWGANYPYEYGDLVGWGDPTGKHTEDPSDYTGEEQKRIYCYYGYYLTDEDWFGVTPRENISGTEWDIAYQHTEGNWRLPTYDEQLELLHKCTWRSITYKGIDGMRVIGLNGNDIFLPYAGSRNGEKIIRQGSEGYYWSGTANTGIFSSGPYCLGIPLSGSSSVSKPYTKEAYVGRSVRPVQGI
ncbi:MAG TPA: fimbrillin family protein [Candidatus Bacteroides merdavium]|uniref:Fimbrillin family protein n=1 Tax=Candidatus Bacteroides merdavium TaxID=2838472 RepID=A0A9D2KEU0_9BACE|nr:fimbrillin family protein [Candidatus Bacteroides merdavium]